MCPAWSGLPGSGKCPVLQLEPGSPTSTSGIKSVGEPDCGRQWDKESDTQTVTASLYIADFVKSNMAGTDNRQKMLRQ